MSERPSSSRIPRPLTVALVALAVCATVVVALLPNEEAPTPAPIVRASASASVRTAPPPAPRPVRSPPSAEPPEPREETADPDDPFAGDIFDRPAAAVLHDARARYEQGKRFSAPMRMELYRYGEEHPDDPRPQLLLAYDELRLGWWRAAVGHYERALDADPATRSSPKVLTDLVELSQRGELDRAAAALGKHFGRSAIGAIDAALEEARAAEKPSRVQRLEELRARL